MPGLQIDYINIGPVFDRGLESPEDSKATCNACAYIRDLLAVQSINPACIQLPFHCCTLDYQAHKLHTQQPEFFAISASPDCFRFEHATHQSQL